MQRMETKLRETEIINSNYTPEKMNKERSSFYGDAAKKQENSHC